MRPRPRAGRQAVHVDTMLAMAMTLRLPPETEAYLRMTAEEEHRSLNQMVIVAIDAYLSEKWTQEILDDPEAVREIEEAEEEVRRGDVLHGVDAITALVMNRPDVQAYLAEQEKLPPAASPVKRKKSRRPVSA